MSSRLPPDPYAALGVKRDATQREIRGAYRALMRQHHPDTAPQPEATSTPETSDVDAGANVRAITAAYGLLSDPERRAAYDAATVPKAAPKAAPRARQKDPPVRLPSGVDIVIGPVRREWP